MENNPWEAQNVHERHVTSFSAGGGKPRFGYTPVYRNGLFYDVVRADPWVVATSRHPLYARQRRPVGDQPVGRHPLDSKW